MKKRDCPCIEYAWIEEVELYFNLTSCVMSYAIPLFGIIYWYVSVPFFLKRRALTTLVASRFVAQFHIFIFRNIELLFSLFFVLVLSFFPLFAFKTYLSFLKHLSVSFLACFFFSFQLPHSNFLFIQTLLRVLGDHENVIQ